VLADLGVPAAGLALADGSGLSLDNRISPATVAAALGAAVDHRNLQLWPVPSGLAVAGFDGTLATRFDDPANATARGEVRAKTGTLGPVSALAGQVVTADGQLLLFAFLVDAAPDTLAARQALDDAASVLAGCGCR
jgi:D-alanyl-D-alanine carboxypeptidase/D-alanyl-D-alanine-endopeptidase (penicillin-binding protein 4)